MEEIVSRLCLQWDERRLGNWRKGELVINTFYCSRQITQNETTIKLYINDILHVRQAKNVLSKALNIFKKLVSSKGLMVSAIGIFSKRLHSIYEILNKYFMCEVFFNDNISLVHDLNRKYLLDVYIKIQNASN